MKALALAGAALCSAYGGFAALSLAMDRHHEDSFAGARDPLRDRPWLRAVGIAGLLLSLLGSLELQGATQGWVLWFGVLMAGALCVVLTLTYLPRRALQFGLVAWAVGLVLLVVTSLAAA